jgi:hypothetical protein
MSDKPIRRNFHQLVRPAAHYCANGLRHLAAQPQEFPHLGVDETDTFAL